MNTIVNGEEGAFALRLNQIVQAQTGQGYWISGGDCAPGTSSTEITVSVDPGTVSIGGQTVDFAGNDNLPLPAADSQPRVDVVSVQSNGNFSVTEGTPHSYAPTPGGSDPAPFEFWEPSPDDGRNVTGVPLCYVLVEPGTSDATGMPNSHVDDNIRIPGRENSEFVLGNGQDNGPTQITVNDADFSVRDETDAEPNYIWRDHSEGALNIGSPNAVPTFDQSLDVAQTNTALDFGTDPNVQGIWSVTAGASGDRYVGQTGPGQSDNGAFNIRNTTVGDNLFTVPTDGGADLQNAPLKGVTQIQPLQKNAPFIDFTNATDGTKPIFAIDTGGASPIEYVFSANPGRESGIARHLVYEDITNSEDLFALIGNGVLYLRDNMGSLNRTATRQWVNDTQYSAGETASGIISTTEFLEVGTASADPSSPSNNLVRLYESQGRIEAKWPDGTTAVLGQK